jgi:hypothetical protein
MRAIRVPLAVALTAVPIFAASQMPADEAAVRSAYAAVMLRTQITSILSTYSTGPLSFDRQIKIEISDVHGGPVSEILAAPISTLVTLPRGELIVATPASLSINNHFLAAGLQVRWGPLNQRYNFNNDYTTFDLPLSEIWEGALAASPRNFRYSKFSVSLSYQGKNRSYQALALIRDGEAPRFVDYILGPPDGLIGKNLVEDLVNLHNNLPVRSADLVMLQEFFRSIEMYDPCTGAPATNLCCDPDGILCGVPRSALPFLR